MNNLSNLLAFFGNYLKQVKNSAESTMQNFVKILKKPVCSHMMKLRKSLANLDKARKNLDFVKEEMKAVDSSMLNYHQSCKSFESAYIELLILDDVSSYHDKKVSKKKEKKDKNMVNGRKALMDKTMGEYRQKIKDFNSKVLRMFNPIVSSSDLLT